MKKWISIFIGVLLIFNLYIPISAGAESTSLNLENYELLLKRFKGIGIMPADAPENPKTVVTHRQFLMYMRGITGEANIASENCFGISESSMGELITYESAAKIGVDLLGWSAKAQAEGYVSTAGLLHLNRGIVCLNGTITQYDAVMLIANMLKADCLKQDTFGKASKFSAAKGGILGMYRNVYTFEGEMIQNQWSSVYSENGGCVGRVTVSDKKLGETEFYYTGLDAYEKLGTLVFGYYMEEDDEKIVIYMENDVSRETVLTSEMEPQFNIHSRCMEYYVNGGRKSVNIPPTVCFIINGMYYNPESSAESIPDKNYELSRIRLIDTDSDGVINTVSVFRYWSGVVSNVSVIRNTIAFKDGKHLAFDRNKLGDKVIFAESDGRYITLEDIKKNDVLNIFEGIGEENVIWITRYNENFTAKIISFNADDRSVTLSRIVYEKDDTTLSQEVEKYRLSKSVSDCIPGEAYRVFLGLNGSVASILPVKDSSSKKTGFYIKIAKSGSFGEYKILMMPDLEDPETCAKVIPVSGNAKIEMEIDGTKETIRISDSDVDTVNQTMFHSVMYYYTDSEGKITRIIGAQKNSESGCLSVINPENNFLITMNGSSNYRSSDGSRDGFYSGYAYSAPTAKDSYFYNSDGARTNFLSDGDLTHLYGKNTIMLHTLESGSGDELIESNTILVPDVSYNQVTSAMTERYYRKIRGEYSNLFSTLSSGGMRIKAYCEGENIRPSYAVLSLNLYDLENLDYLSNMCQMAKYIMLVNDVSYALNDNNEVVQKIECSYGVDDNLTFLSSNEKVIDVSNSTADNIKYLEITEGDILLPLLDVNGDVLYAMMIYDYDPNTKTGICPKGIRGSVLRAFKDKNGDIVNEFTMNTLAISSGTFVVAGYPYKEANHAPGTITTGVMAAEFVLDNEALKAAKDPLNSAEQETFLLRDRANTVINKKIIGRSLIYDTGSGTHQGRITRGTITSGTGYFEDKNNMSKVVYYSRNGMAMMIVIYK